MVAIQLRVQERRLLFGFPMGRLIGRAASTIGSMSKLDDGHRSQALFFYLINLNSRVCCIWKLASLMQL